MEDGASAEHLSKVDCHAVRGIETLSCEDRKQSTSDQ